MSIEEDVRAEIARAQAACEMRDRLDKRILRRNYENVSPALAQALAQEEVVRMLQEQPQPQPQPQYQPSRTLRQSRPPRARKARHVAAKLRSFRTGRR